MDEREFRGVERLTRSAAGIRLRRLARLMRVELFAAERMADLRKVNADLMRAAGFEAAFEDCVIGQVLQWPNMRDCLLCVFRGLLLRAD